MASRPHTLVLGASGMVGSTVYKYLKKNNPKTVFGTSHTKITANKFIFLDVISYQNEFKKITSQIKIDYVINCIGKLRGTTDMKELLTVNALFPHQLTQLAEENQWKVIHISTDAVFPESQGAAFESTTPYPTDKYGMSKLLGEIETLSALTIRTSIIGHDNTKTKGLISWIDNTNEDEIPGYANQTWSGCTALQFAKLCDDIISNNKFHLLRKKSAIFHFAPIKKTTKYDLIKNYCELSGKKVVVKKRTGPPITRYLASEYESLLNIDRYESSVLQALKELLYK